MVFDAAALWWPPFSKLYNQLETLKLEPGAVAAETLKATLKEYEPWLARGVAGFQPPSDASRQALEGEASLAIGAKKLPLEAGLRAAAADLSRSLQLDEVQAYVLLRRWVAKAGGGGGGGGASAAQAVITPGAPLSPAQRLEVAQLYFSERLCLLKSIEDLLWEGERAEGGPLLDVIEGTLQALLEQLLEDTTFQALQANLQPPAAGSANGSNGGAAGAVVAAAASPSPLVLAAYAGGGSGSTAAAAAAALADARAATAAAERCCLLNILILIYYHPRKQCTPDRFLSLASLFHATLFTRPSPRGGAAGGAEGEPTAAAMSVKLATVLLLEMLDVDKALAALAAQQPLDEGCYVFAAPAVKDRVNAELSSWWPAASAAHSPVLLAWAAVLCLMAKTAEHHPGGHEYEAHAIKAHEADALGTMCRLTGSAGLQPNAVEMFNNIVLSTMSAAFCAFDFSPAALSLPQLDAVVAVLSNLFRGQPALCEGFWAGDRLTDEPLRHFLDDVRGLYPALPAPLYALLAALSSTADSAASANAYLASLPGLTCLHVLPDQAIEQDCNEDGDVYAQQAVALPGSRALTLPQGALGEPAPLPEGFSSTDALWTVAAGQDVDHVQLVRWRIKLPDGVGQWILLCRLSEALAAVQQQAASAVAPSSAAAAHAAAALAELGAAVQLLAAVCSRDPQTALELLHVELPAGPAAEGGQRGPDLLYLACQAVAVLVQLPEPPTAIIGDCLSICTSLAEGIPGRVVHELLSLCGVPPAMAAGAAALAPGQAPEVPLLSRLLAAESAAGRYPATQAFLRLLTALVSAAAPALALAVLVVWVLYRLLAEHRNLRYVQRAERWRLAGMGLRLVRLALLSAPSPVAASTGDPAAALAAPEGGSAIAAAVAEVLRYDVGMTACLLCALPYHAEQLERACVETRFEGEVEAVEECCVEWHRLLPVLLPAVSPDARLAPSAFFRPCPAPGGGPDAPAASAAAVLLSYISYPYFGSSQRALVMRSMHCLAAAAAATAPGAVFAVLLPQEGPEAGVASAARGAITAAFSPEAAAATPELLSAACDALVTAVECHPSLLDALFFPCGLEQALLDKENTSSNAAALPAPGDAGKAGGNGGGKGGKAPAPRSCLDALWELLQRREQLQKEHPAVLAKLLQVLSAFWRSSSAAFRAVAVLQRQPELWGHITGLLEAAGTAGPLSVPVLHGGDAHEAFSAASWAAQEPSTALIAAEASALQIVAAECHTWAAAGASSAAAMPADLAAFLKRLSAGLVPQLLERYALPLPTSSLLAAAQQAAAAGGLQLLGAALSDEALWRSMGEGAGLAPQLAAAAQPLLRQFSSQADAARMLADHAPQIAARNFRSQHAAVAIAQLVMQQAEVPERVASDREFGASFVYDSSVLGRRLGSVLVQQLEHLQQLSGWLEAASVAASLEDARLAAVTALKALLTASHRHRQGGGAPAGSGGAAAVRSALGTLAEALGDVASHAQHATDRVHAAAAEATAVDAVGVHLSSASEAAYILLLLAQQWSAGTAGKAADEGEATTLCTGVLQATRDWLDALEGVDLAALSSSPDAAPAAASVTHSLLAAALVLLPAAPAAGDAVQLPDEAQQRLQGVATQLLPLLLAACHRQPPQLVLVVSLATALIDRLVPAAAWLPLLRGHLHFGNLLHSMLLSLHSAAQQAAQQRAAAAAPAAAGAPPAAPLPLALPPVPAAMRMPALALAAEADAAPLPSSISPLAAASVEEAALLLALQVAQTRGGAELLLEQGALAHALALGKWLLSPEGGNLMGETPQAAGSLRSSAARFGAKAATPAGATVVDYSNAYRQDGSPNPAHRLWCCVLSLLAVLLAALPGHAAVEQAALQLAVEAEPRLLLAAEPPAASSQQPLTLAMAQETKYTLFLLCGLARLSGQWRMMLPDALPAFRRATAALLDFAAAPGATALTCAPVSAAERAAAKLDGPSGGSAGASASASGGALQLRKGWFGAAAAGTGRGAGGARAGGYAWQLAERLYSSAQYALSFQLALAPEVGEEELAELGPEWVRPATLLALQEDALDVAEALPVDARTLPSACRLARSVQALLGLSSQLQDGMGAERSHPHKQAVNCNPDTGECQCPYGRVGPACATDMLSACRLKPDGPANCGFTTTKNCACWRQCERFHCRDGYCELPRQTIPPDDRTCFMREGVPLEQQTSRPPDRDEAGVKLFMGWREGAREAANASERALAMREKAVETLPLADCPEACSGMGHCLRFFADPDAKPHCRCPRSYTGVGCEQREEPLCYLNCSGHGKCIDMFCHCEPPYFSIGCSRNQSHAPAGVSRRSAVQFKIYMYELPSSLAYPVEHEAGEPSEDKGQGEYAGYMHFLSQFLNSTVRTEDPEEAHLFYLPTFTYAYTRMNTEQVEHLNHVLEHVRQAHPFFNRTGGRDHFFWHPSDRGGCYMFGHAERAIKVLQFGWSGDPRTSLMEDVRERTKTSYSCYHPLRDVIAATHDNAVRDLWAPFSHNQTLEGILAGKTSLFFWSGSHGGNTAEYSGNSRQTLRNLTQQWKDPQLEIYWHETEEHPQGWELGEAYWRNKFCYVAYGWGFSNRLSQAIHNNCIPVIVQEHVFQPYENLLPYEDFSIRLTNADLPRLREILRSVTEDEYRRMMQALLAVRPAFSWTTAVVQFGCDDQVAQECRELLAEAMLEDQSVTYFARGALAHRLGMWRAMVSLNYAAARSNSEPPLFFCTADRSAVALCFLAPQQEISMWQYIMHGGLVSLLRHIRPARCATPTAAAKREPPPERCKAMARPPGRLQRCSLAQAAA
ncbi:exostosin-like glycosyltransferase isoform B [Micractinium conductrix]|uniref:Exostosin-like glycosyltransferase isoform B n=1 Tax=Micractinium conductrix TaxID=554055 RepID=A0A2P6VEL0_9CHLO|nr:exostosin-like glycosyltransferase isoform B [Micractinium conductrix]|eukprot:PSC72509.1 exostosin-like glycosyltransferase isoform B [Micractinium conductrix]